MPRLEGRISGQEVPPEMLVQAAVKHKCKTIAYTYTEPAVFWDYAFDAAKLATPKGIKNIFVTNGFLSEASLTEIIPYLHGANVDLKSFDEEMYKSICGARLKPVLDNICLMKEKGVWVEITTLLIPDLNDSTEELKAIAKFIAELDPGIPWHISRFHPTYRMMDRPPTSLKLILRACEIGKEAGLRYVYIGNIPGEEGESTFCYHCGAKLIHRWGFEVMGNRLVDGGCPECGTDIDGIW
jgi:pyruvate formate lyase activating enzyme